jgi:hypothetical protein
MGVPALEVSYTSSTTGRGDHEVLKGHVVALEKKTLTQSGSEGREVLVAILFAVYITVCYLILNSNFKYTD